MRAVVIREPGGPEVLELRDVPDPDVPHGHVRVAVRFAGVNRADLLQRVGIYPAPPGVPADIPGLEYAGVVDAVGPGASLHRAGDRVYGLVAGGSYAEKVVAHEREVVAVPAGLSDAAAAAVPEAFVTAWDALLVRGALAPGERVLVTAAASGVGTAAVQIARALGCFTVGTTRSADKVRVLRELGASAAIVPEGQSFAKQVLEATGGAGVDVALELVGGAYVGEDLRASASRARIVVVGLTGGAATDLDLRELLRRRVAIVGTVLRSRPLEEKIEAAQLLARRIGPLLAEGRLRPVVDRVFDLADAGLAHEHVAGNAGAGKVLLRVA